MKQEIVEYYAKYIEEFKAEYPEDIAKNAESILNSITNYMLDADYSDKLPEFVKFTKYLDQTRGHSILDIAPEYERLFK
jgi:thiaminase